MHRRRDAPCDSAAGCALPLIAAAVWPVWAAEAFFFIIALCSLICAIIPVRTATCDASVPSAFENADKCVFSTLIRSPLEQTTSVASTARRRLKMRRSLDSLSKGSGMRCADASSYFEKTERCMFIAPTCSCVGCGTHGTRQYQAEVCERYFPPSARSSSACWSTKPVRRQRRSTSCSMTISGSSLKMASATFSRFARTVPRRGAEAETARPPS
mmetsp:Transcript_13381/g.34087  ORF Transcript_13381/g.34087 Transcript_13381/m.34087 type:complete len:214 (+) Transcript_13381:722-1363(+)